MPERLLVSTAAGKDSTLALHEVLRRHDAYRAASLFATYDATAGRLPVHGLRVDLLRAHAAALGLPLLEVPLPHDCPDKIYAERTAEALIPWRERGVRGVLYGDIGLADVRAWREHHLASLGMFGVFPLWDRDPADLARRFLDLGFRALVTAVDTDRLDVGFVGRTYDEAFLRDLPAGVDPCGENGEFHTFAFDGPLFARPVGFTLGEIDHHGRHAVQDLLPAGTPAAAAPSPR